MAEDLAQLEAWAGALLTRLSAGQRTRLTRAIAGDLRRAQVQRIAAQRNPDGTSFAPRKALAGVGRIKKRAAARAMFVKLRRSEFLSAEGDASEARVGFKNAGVARIARVHQEGLRDRVTRKRGAPTVKYPARVLLGVTDEDQARIMDLVLVHLDKA